jgi:hypothetical protein
LNSTLFVLVDDSRKENTQFLGLKCDVLSNVVSELAKFDYAKGLLVELHGDTVAFDRFDEADDCKSAFSERLCLLG